MPAHTGGVGGQGLSAALVCICYPLYDWREAVRVQSSPGDQSVPDRSLMASNVAAINSKNTHVGYDRLVLNCDRRCYEIVVSNLVL